MLFKYTVSSFIISVSKCKQDFSSFTVLQLPVIFEGIQVHGKLSKLEIRRYLRIKNLHVLKWRTGEMYVGDAFHLSKPVASLKICHIKC